MSVACRPSVVQARGLIAVGQRLPPMIRTRTNHLKGETLVIFPWWGRFRAQHVVRSLGRPQRTWWWMRDLHEQLQIRFAKGRGSPLGDAIVFTRCRT